jgi:GNAT superfamily N-acetyltransferase
MHRLGTIVSFTRHTTEMTADDVQRLENGWIFDSRSLPVAYGLNHVRLSRPTSFEAAAQLADRAQAHLPFRRVTIEPQALSPGVEAAFIGAGWKPERDLLMVLSGQPGRQLDTSRVVEVSEAEHLELGRMWTLETAPETTEAVLDALCEFWSRESRARGDRLLGVRGLGGDGILAKAKLRSDGRTAQVEDVYTLASARGQGLGRALVTRAVELAEADGHEVIFIVADADDWPKQLYAQIGFEAVGTIVHFHRQLTRPAAEPPPHRRTALPSA